METIKIKPQLLTAEAFAPYGTVIGGEGQGDPDFANDGGTLGWRVDLNIAKPLYMTLRTPPAGRVVTELERHLNLTQAFLPLGGGKATLAVAKPTEGGRLPTPEEVTVFLLDGSVGYALHLGTWHGLDRMPVTDQATMWLMITDADTQADLANVPKGVAKHTEMMDLPQAWGFSIEIDI